MGTVLVKSALNALKIEVFKTKLVAHFLPADFGVLNEFDLRIIFDQWSKLHLGLDVRPEIPILKGL